MHFTLTELAEKLGARLVLKGEAEPIVHGLKALTHAKVGDLTFLANPKYKPQLAKTQASAVLLAEGDLDACPTHALVMNNPYLGFAKIAALLDRTPKATVGIHPTAIIGKNCDIADSVSIGPYVVIGEGVKIGPRVVLGAHSTLSDRVTILDETVLKAQVTVYHEVLIGKRCIIHSGAVIGSDGFGMANDRGRWVKIPQLGSVVLEDDVEIGANTTIDRGAIDNTVIQTGVKIDNQVQIAHNVAVGAHTAMAAQTGVAGSTTIGKHCIIGGKVAITGHIELADQVMLTGGSSVSHSLHAAGIYSSSFSCKPQGIWNKTLARLNRLDKMAEQIRALKQELAELKQGK